MLKHSLGPFFVFDLKSVAEREIFSRVGKVYRRLAELLFDYHLFQYAKSRNEEALLNRQYGNKRGWNDLF